MAPNRLSRVLGVTSMTVLAPRTTGPRHMLSWSRLVSGDAAVVGGDAGVLLEGGAGLDGRGGLGGAGGGADAGERAAEVGAQAGVVLHGQDALADVHPAAVSPVALQEQALGAELGDA